MAKIFRYELKRLLCSKLTIGLLVVIGFYSHWLMNGEVILGIANTAPFSPWSFGYYLAKILPLLMLALLFFISFLYSKKEKEVEVLTSATSVKPPNYRMVRYAAIAAAALLITAVPIIYAIGFYSIVFHFTKIQTLILPTIYVILPAFAIWMGAGVLSGRFHPAAVFILMPAALLVGFLPLHGWADLYDTAFFVSYPAELGMLDPIFEVPTQMVICKVVYLLIGFILTIIAAKRH